MSAQGARQLALSRKPGKICAARCLGVRKFSPRGLQPQPEPRDARWQGGGGKVAVGAKSDPVAGTIDQGLDPNRVLKGTETPISAW